TRACASRTRLDWQTSLSSSCVTGAIRVEEAERLDNGRGTLFPKAWQKPGRQEGCFTFAQKFARIEAPSLTVGFLPRSWTFRPIPLGYRRPTTYFPGGVIMATAMAAISPKEELNPFEIAKQQFDRAADYLELEESLRNVLRSAKRQLIVSIPVRMDGGETKVF